MASGSSPVPFASAVTLDIGKEPVAVTDARQASEVLMSVDWPGERTATHAEAVETCLKVLDGHRSAEDARSALVAAAQDAGILVAS